MKHSARTIATVLLFGLAFSSAQATPVLFDPGNDGSKVDAYITGCWGYCGIDASVHNLDGVSASLNKGVYWTFDFSDVSVWLENILAAGHGNTTTVSATVRLVSVPEPGTLALFGIGLIGLALGRRRRI